MLNCKQTERLINKVARLDKVYEPFLVESATEMDVTITEKGTSRKISAGENWGGDFCYANFCFTVPTLQQNKRYWLFAETGATEHLIFVNGKEVGLTDYTENLVDEIFRIHKYVLLENLCCGDNVKLEGYFSHTFVGTMPYDEKTTYALNSYSPNRKFKSVSLLTLYEELLAFCEKLRALNAERARLLRENSCSAKLNETYIKLFETLSLKKQRPAEQSLVCACKTIDNYFESLQKGENLPYIGIIGHSHLDTAWLWTTEETRHKLLRTISNAVTLLKRYPKYKFFLSTVLYLQWLEQDSPALFAEVSELIKQGRIEVNGSSWVECDCNLVGAESLCRQFVRGKRYLRSKFGVESDTFWLPDTFGYSAALPQICNQCNVKYFLTTKLSWNDTNKFPYGSFVWKGLDGSQVTVHFNSIQTWIDSDSVSARLNEVTTAEEKQCLLMAYGFGDGGGGPSDEMVRRALATEENCSFANVEHTTVSDFMHKLSQKQLPTYYGELYLELHRGTFTTNTLLKQYNRRLEEALHDAELLSVLQENKQPTDALYDILLQNQFHDILPGTCIPEATDMALSQQRDALQKAQQIVLGTGKRKRYFNTLPFERTELLPCETGQDYPDFDGTLRKFDYKHFDKFGYATDVEQNGQFVIDGENICTPQLSAKLQNGVLTSVKWHGREFVKTRFNAVRCAEDVPYIYDNWDIDADYVLKEKDAEFLDSKVVSLGQKFAVVRVRHKLSEKSTLTTDIVFRSDSPLITFDSQMDFHDDHLLVRTYFDTTLFSSKYVCDTQFGCIERNAFCCGSADEAKFEVCSHKWTDLSEKQAGISLLSDSKYGVSCKDGVLGLTLIKSGTHPDDRADNGVFRFRYGILPHDGSLGMQTVQSGYCFSHRPAITTQNIKVPFALSDDSTAILETVKHGEEGGMVLRFYESLGATTELTLTFEKEVNLKHCNILEDVLCQEKGKQFTLCFRPFEIKTLLVD